MAMFCAEKSLLVVGIDSTVGLTLVAEFGSTLTVSTVADGCGGGLTWTNYGQGQGKSWDLR